MDEYTDINQLLEEIKKLRAQKAAAVESTEANGDGKSSEIKQTKTWVEEPWDVSNLVDSIPIVNSIEVIENGSETNDLDIPEDEPTHNEDKSTSIETIDENPIYHTSVVQTQGNPVRNLHSVPPPQCFPLRPPRTYFHSVPQTRPMMPPPHVMLPPPHVMLTARPQQTAPLQRHIESSRSKAGYTPKPLSVLHIVPKALDIDQIPKVPPFVCRFENLPENTTDEDITKLLDRLKIKKIQFPHNAENSEAIRYVEFNDRHDLITVLDAPVLFIKGNIVSAKPVIIECPPKTSHNPKVSVKPEPPKQNPSPALTRVVYLYGLPKDVNIAEMNAPFSAYKIRALILPTEFTPYGYVEFEHAEQLLLAMQKQDLIIRNRKIIMSIVELKPLPIITPEAVSINAPANPKKQSRPQQNQTRPQENQSNSKARNSSADSQTTVASTGSFAKSHPNGQLPKHVLLAALKENSSVVSNIASIPNGVKEPKLDVKVCIKNAKKHSDYVIGYWCGSLLDQVSTNFKLQRDARKNEVIVSLDTQRNAMRLCSALKDIQVNAEIVEATNEPNSAFFVRNNYFDELLTGQCIRCAGVSEHTCAKCGRFYCNVECQRIDWPNHSTICTKIPDFVTAAQYLLASQQSPFS